MIKAKVAFLESRLFSSHSGLFETFQIALIGWIKAGPPKSHFCFDHVNRLKKPFKGELVASLHDHNKSGFFEGPAFIQPIRTI